MEASLIGLEKLLNISFSELFCEFWENHIPDRTPVFSVKIAKLGGSWGQRGYDLNTKQALIEIEENLESFHKEITLTHEILHIVLELEGYPLIYSDQQQLKRNLQNAGAIAENLHSVLVHPIIWFRMRKWGFPVDKHIGVKATGQLKDLESIIDKYPSRSNFPLWCYWVLKYVLARLEWEEPERQMIYEMFLNRHVPIGKQGEKLLNRLDKLGYFEPESLSPEIVTETGNILLQLLDLKRYYSLGFI